MVIYDRIIGIMIHALVVLRNKNPFLPERKCGFILIAGRKRISTRKSVFEIHLSSKCPDYDKYFLCVLVFYVTEW